MAIDSVSYGSYSPYKATPLFDGKFLDLMQYKTIPQYPDDIYHEITAVHHMRPDLMSYDMYGTVDFWYVFMLRNRDTIIDPIYNFTQGTKIYIPKIETIRKYLG